MRQIEPLNWTLVYQDRCPKHELSFELHFLVRTNSVPLQNDAMYESRDTSLCLILILGPHLKSFGPIRFTPLDQMDPFCWTLSLGHPSIVPIKQLTTLNMIVSV
jgi:hypothetical protein